MKNISAAKEMIDPRLDELYMESALKVGLLANLIPVTAEPAANRVNIIKPPFIMNRLKQAK
ncbi:hypothetical protein LCGC14_2841450 [marine sediment metagenome]|uniref:Uncharacterized protein n=1 Tax=marine sediment metagenome TaxID=412755 RepID=A0A0F9B274_9ZZZZ